MKTMVGWSGSLRFPVAFLLAWCSQTLAQGAVAGDPDPDALDRWELRTNLLLKAIDAWVGEGSWA